MGQLVDVAPPQGFDPSDDVALMVNRSRDNVNPSGTLAIAKQKAVIVLRRGVETLFDENTGRFYSVTLSTRYRDTTNVSYTPGTSREIVGVALDDAAYGEQLRVKFSGTVDAFVVGSPSTTYKRGVPLVLSALTSGVFVFVDLVSGTAEGIGTLKVYAWLADRDVVFDATTPPVPVKARILLFGISGISADGA